MSHPVLGMVPTCQRCADKFGLSLEQSRHPAIMRPYTTVMVGNFVAECPECHHVCVYWDDDDLDEEGNLLCYGD